MVWDEAQQRDSFAALWKLTEVSVVTVNGEDVGWLQVNERPTEVRLLQFFIAPVHQRRGIGTEILGNLVAAWKTTARPVRLTVLKNNPARQLYERAGFSVVGEIGVKFEMKLKA
nr:GNAT family N-acetyltransferase [Bradyrhizobium sp. 179]